MDNVTDITDRIRQSIKAKSQPKNFSQSSSEREIQALEDAWNFRLDDVGEQVKRALVIAWNGFIQIHGAGWYKTFGHVGDEAFVTWCCVLRDLSAQQIADGFARYAISDDQFLDAKKFRKFCVGEEKIPAGLVWDATACAWRKPELRAENLLCSETHDERVERSKSKIASLREILRKCE